MLRVTHLKNPVLPSIFDGIGMGLGFTVGLTCIGIVREVIGAGQIFGYQLLPLADEAAGKAGYVPVTIFILAPGAFLVLAGLVALQNKIKKMRQRRARRLQRLPDAEKAAVPAEDAAAKYSQREMKNRRST